MIDLNTRPFPRSASRGNTLQRRWYHYCPLFLHTRFPARPAEPHAFERAGREVGRRQCRGSPLGHAAYVRLSAARSHGYRRRPGAARFSHGSQAVRRAVHVPARRARAAAPCTRTVHARYADRRARLHRVLHALHRQCGDADRHDAAAEIRSRHVRGEAGRGRRGRSGRGRAALPHFDGRDHAHELGARRDPPRRRAADSAHRAFAVLPLRGRKLRQGHARHDPPAPVRQGRDGADRASRPLVRRRSKR